jgi:guanosine-3',5'-bis(diphosphate) 3'-pyrophosphohydrolase
MAGIGYGKYSSRSVLAKVIPGSNLQPGEEQQGLASAVKRAFGADSSALTVRGTDDLLVYRARCCNPIRGEEIVGYVTRGKGVAVHSNELPQRAEPDVRTRAPHRRRVVGTRSPASPAPCLHIRSNWW